MQPVNPADQRTFEHLSDILKVALVVLAFVATALGVAGDKWNEEKKRLTALGYGVVATALLVLIAGTWSWRVDAELKLSSDQKQADAVANQKKADDDIIAGLKQANTDLHTAMTFQQTTLAFAKTQLPVEDVEISFKRSQIASALPDEFKDKDFSFEKPRGQQPPDDEMLVHFIVFPEKDPNLKSIDASLNLLDAFRFGEYAMNSFDKVFYRICRIQVSPGSLSEDKTTAKMRIGSDDYYLTQMVLSKDSLTYIFEPDGVSVSYFDGSAALLSIGKSVSVAFGKSSIPKTTPCVIPREMRLKIDTIGFKSDTGYFPITWHENYSRWTSMTPTLKLVPSAENQASVLSK